MFSGDSWLSFKWLWLMKLWAKEAFVGLFRNSWWSLMAMLLSAASLLVFSAAYISGMNADYFAQTLNQKVEVRVDLLKTASRADAEAKIKALSEVKEVAFVSKQEAYKKMEAGLGTDSDVLHSLNENPFPDRLVIKLNNSEQAAQAAGQIKAMGIAESVQYGKEYVDTMISAAKLIRNIGYAVTGLGAVFTIFVVVSTIKINIAQRWREIEIKQLVGAGMLTTRIPFIAEAILLTGASGVATYFYIFFGYGKAAEAVKKMAPYLPLISVDRIMDSVFLPLAALALGIGFIGSLLSTRRFLKKF